MRYPIKKASSILGSGHSVYQYLIKNIHIPAKLTHEIWYNSCETLRTNPNEAFRGFFPVGETLKLSYAGAPMADYTFTGDEKNPIFVKNLSLEAKMSLGISNTISESDKVFNPLFKPYEKLPSQTKKDNELPTLSLAKSITSYLSSKDVLFTESDVVGMIRSALEDANSDEMRHILHVNHVAWCATRFMIWGTMEEDIKKNFYSQNEVSFYVKDIGTIVPSMLYCLAFLGVDPLEAIAHIDYDLWGIEDTAKEMQKFMLIHQESQKTA